MSHNVEDDKTPRAQRVKELKLTRKQKAFADGILAEPKKAATLVALETYGKPDKPTTYMTAAQIAEDNLKKPQIMLYLQQHAVEAEKTMYRVMNRSEQLMEESPGYAAVAKSAASDILDRIHGKATQQVETTSKQVVINIDLTSE